MTWVSRYLYTQYLTHNYEYIVTQQWNNDTAPGISAFGKNSFLYLYQGPSLLCLWTYRAAHGLPLHYLHTTPFRPNPSTSLTIHQLTTHHPSKYSGLPSVAHQLTTHQSTFILIVRAAGALRRNHARPNRIFRSALIGKQRALPGQNFTLNYIPAFTQRILPV